MLRAALLIVTLGSLLSSDELFGQGMDLTDEVVIVAAEVQSNIDSVSALTVALTNAGAAPVVIDSLDQILGSPNSVWYVGGTFPDYRPLNAVDGEILVSLQSGGTGLYVQSSDAWGFDVPTDFASIDGVDPVFASPGLGFHEGMIGADFLTGITAPYVQERPTGDFLNELYPAPSDLLGPDARILLADDGVGGTGYDFSTAIAYYTNSGGRVISAASEFASIGRDLDLVGLAMLDFLEGPPASATPFIRADVNGDTQLDATDVIAMLEELFVPGTTPGDCDDAFDANDDGNKDLSDAVFLAAFLFVAGSPAPFPALDCGLDVTADPLDCDLYSSCP